MPATTEFRGVSVRETALSLGCHIRGNRMNPPGREHFSVALNDSKNVWYDHRDGVGGGAIQLVQHVFGCTWDESLAWLRSNGFLLDMQIPSGLRRLNEKRRAIAEEAKRIDEWRRGRIELLEEIKHSAYDAGDLHTLAAASRELFLLAKDGPSIVGLYREREHRDPEDIERTIKWWRNDPA